MATQCTPGFDQISVPLGNFRCEQAPPFLHLSNPFHLTNGTLPVLELMMVIGAVIALVHSIRRLRRDGDPTTLAVWAGSLVYLVITEPPLYFPQAFGLSTTHGPVFVHNVFTVDFMYDRLPLYIVALYPALIVLAFEIVRSLGVFRRSNAFVGALCVGLVHQCFYEVFDHLGPQLRWWAWNPGNPNTHPFFDSVPLTSIVLFAAVAPAALTFFVQLLIGRRVAAGAPVPLRSAIWRTFAAGALVTPAVVVVTLPLVPFGGDHPNTAAQAIILGSVLAMFAAVALPTLLRQWRLVRSGAETADSTNLDVRLFGPLYLVVMTGLWISALPDYLRAHHGLTSDGTPTGNAAYALVCAIIATACVVGVRSAVSRASQPAVSPSPLSQPMGTT